MEFLNSVIRIQISKNFSQPFNSVPTASNSSCLPSPSLRAASLDSTHSRNSDTSTNTLQMSCANLCHVSFKFHSENLQRVSLLPTKKNGLPVASTLLCTLKNLEHIC